MKNLIILDCDGTLTDTEGTYINVIIDVLKSYDIHHYDADFCRRELIGMGMNAVQAFFENLEGRNFDDKFVEKFVEIAASHINNGVDAVDGAVDAVNHLNKNFMTCVASNGEFEHVCESLRSIMLFDSFGLDRIFTKSHVARGKPHPDLFLHAAEKMGFAPHNSFVVEDSIVGVRAGVAAGMHTIGITTVAHNRENANLALKAAGATEVFDKWEDIVKYIGTFVEK